MEELIKYTVIKGFYNEKKPVDIYLPKELKLVYKDGSIGDCCHTGHNHYMAFMKYNENHRKQIDDANRYVNTYQFGDLLFIVIRDIKDENNVLPIYDYTEMMEEFDLSNYFIIYKKPTLYKTNLDYDKVVNDLWYEKIQEEHVYQIIRIKDLQGPYYGHAFMAIIESDMPPESTDEFYMLKDHRISDFVDLFSDIVLRKIKVEIKHNAWEEYFDLRDKVLTKM